MDQLVVGEARIGIVGSHFSYNLSHIVAPSQLLYDGSADACDEVVDDKTLLSPDLLHESSEHEDREHIVEEMPEVIMHEHVGEVLPPMVVGCLEIVESEEVLQADASAALQYLMSQQQQGVDDDDVYRNGGRYATSEIVHNTKIFVKKCRKNTVYFAKNPFFLRFLR